MIKRKINEYVYLGKSKIHSTGLFALRKISAGTKIIQYVGELITKREGTRRVNKSIKLSKKDSSKGSTYIFDIDKKYDLDGDIKNNPAKYINHSCNPNCKYKIKKREVWIYSIRDIKPGEEITYNYGFEWNIKDYMDFPCKCGSKNCVGYIVQKKDWKKLIAYMRKNEFVSTKADTAKKYPSKVINISYGKGLVATKDLLPGTIVAAFRGKTIKYKDVPKKWIRYVIYVGSGKDDKWVVSKTSAIYANHSCNPNCAIDEKLNIYTIKKVKKGEELVYSYNYLEDDEKESDFTWDSAWDFVCKCGSRNCQGVIDKYAKRLSKRIKSRQ